MQQGLIRELLLQMLPKKSSLCCCTAQNFVCGIRISRLEFKKGIQCWRAFSGSIANYAENAHESETREDVPKATLIWRAVKLPIYSVALVPLTVVQLLICKQASFQQDATFRSWFLQFLS